MLTGDDSILGFTPADRFMLIRDIDKDEMARGGNYTVDLVAPWHTVYNISRHPTQVEAQTAFEFYDNKIKNAGYKVRIVGPARAEILEPQ